MALAQLTGSMPMEELGQRLGGHRGGGDRAADTLGCVSCRDWTRRRAGPVRTFHRRSPGLGARHRSCRPRPWQATPGDLGCLAYGAPRL